MAMRCVRAPPSQSDVDDFEEEQRERRSLVGGDSSVADRFHSQRFEGWVRPCRHAQRLPGHTGQRDQSGE
eukprot:2438445-Alexandrium_andersonii.AAC.1